MSIKVKNIEYGILNIKKVYSKFKIPTPIFRPQGFTLIELMVSIGIMMIMTAVLFSGYPESITRIGLANTAHKVSLLIREAQVRGSSIDSRSGLNVVSGYGVYVNSAVTNSLILFSDFIDSASVARIPLGNGLYDQNPIDEKDSLLKLLQNFYISNLCVKNSSGLYCNFIHSPSNTDPVVTQTAINNLTISFNRPNPRPNIYINDLKTANYDEACIEIRSPQSPKVPLEPIAGYVRAIKIANTGFITTSVRSCTSL